jgi:hypothetical protein
MASDIVSVAPPVTDGTYNGKLIGALLILTTAPAEVAVTPMPFKVASAFTRAASPAAIVVRVSVDRTVYVSVLAEASPAPLTFIDTVLPAVMVPPMVAAIFPLTLLPREIVSVAPLLVEPVYVGVLLIVITAPEDVAVTLYATNLESAAIADFRPVAMVVVVAPVGTM